MQLEKSSINVCEYAMDGPLPTTAVIWPELPVVLGERMLRTLTLCDSGTARQELCSPLRKQSFLVERKREVRIKHLIQAKGFQGEIELKSFPTSHS